MSREKQWLWNLDIPVDEQLLRNVLLACKEWRCRPEDAIREMLRDCCSPPNRKKPPLLLRGSKLLINVFIVLRDARTGREKIIDNPMLDSEPERTPTPRRRKKSYPRLAS